ncbi:MAG: neutral/alkaline non-lysosomal ceramidase N-terminal domain-containing protein [Cyclobacteriaceae bacterium]|jgi:hypothetical protein|nr:neutral/alkaline non-lysosomal ceramidase N-terminal domain-containing protein [Cyclobacteriaceae bacterium]
MKAHSIVFLFAILSTFGCSSKREDAGSITLKVGASSSPVNPSLGSFIAGDKQNRTFTAVHDSLYAKAVVADDGNTMLAIVTIDCIGLLYPQVNAIREQAARLTLVPYDHIVVSSTHTHSGPDVVGLWGADYEHSGVDSAYLALLVQTAAEQIRLAYEQRKPVTVVTAQTSYGEEWVANIADEEIDRSVSIMGFVDESGKMVATLTNFACHPTFMDAVFSHVSSDYIGAFYHSMKKHYPGEHLFLQGAIGGWVQPVEGKGSLEKAKLRGDELASVVKNALSSPDTLTSCIIKFESEKIYLPVENEAWKQLSASGLIKRVITDSVETEVAWFAIGNAQFATHPGETTPYLGLKTKNMMSGNPKFVMGLTQDALGYILKPEFFEDPPKPHSEYLTRMSVGKKASPIIEETLSRIIPHQAD